MSASNNVVGAMIKPITIARGDLCCRVAISDTDATIPATDRLHSHQREHVGAAAVPSPRRPAASRRPAAPGRFVVTPAVIEMSRPRVSG